MKYTTKRTIQVWICVSYVCLSLSSSTVTGQCNAPLLGMTDATVLNYKFSASTKAGDAQSARLNGNSAWRTDEEYSGNVDFDRSPWVEVDFKGLINVTGIATQGILNSQAEAEFVKLYQVVFKKTKTGGSTYWRSISTGSGGDRTEEFRGADNDVNVNDETRQYFDRPKELRYIRIYPTDCQRKCSLRFELYGCKARTTTPAATTNPTTKTTTRRKTTPSATTKTIPPHITTAPTIAQTTTPTSNPATSPMKVTTMPTIISPAGMSTSDFITSSTTLFGEGVDVEEEIPSEPLVTGSIAGIVIGAFVLVTPVAVCLFLIMRRNNRRPEDKEETQRGEARYDGVNNDVIIAPVNTKPPVYATIEADDTSNENALNKDNKYAYAYTPQQGDGLLSSKTGTNSSMTVAKNAQTSSDCAYAYAEPFGKDVPQHDQGEYAYAYTEGNTSSPTVGGQYSSPQEGWEENSIYASGNNDDNGQGHDMTNTEGPTEGWADNTIYASDGDHGDAIGNNNRGEEGWENNIIYADSGDN